MKVLTMLAGAREGGAETFFVTLSKALAAAGVPTHAVIRKNPPRAELLRAGGVKVAQAPFGRWFDLQTKRTLADALRETRPDVALAFMSRAAAFMPDGPHLKLARLGGFYDIKYYKKCDYLVCITEGIRRHVIKQGWSAARCGVITNFAEVDDSPAVDRAAFDTPEDATVIFTPSRLHRVKGQDVLMRAVVDRANVHLWLAGAGPEEAALKALAEELGMADRVHFLGWRRDTGAFFRACDIVAFPSLHEPFGTVTLEAWAYGKPLVASDADGPAEFIHDDEDALMAPRGDADALGQAIDRLIEENGLSARLVEAGSRRHREAFTQDACVANYLTLFERLRTESVA